MGKDKVNVKNGGSEPDVSGTGSQDSVPGPPCGKDFDYSHFTVGPVASLKTKQRADWLSESYHLAKSLAHQFERAWRKDKSQYNRSRLRGQIAW